MKLIKDLGMLFPKETSKKKSRFGIYECEMCEVHFKGRTADVNHNKQKYCRDCSRLKHGLTKHKLYMTWIGEKQRCTNSNATGYEGYGGRGIAVSDEFKDFKIWLEYVESLENAYMDGYTVDRVENDGNYERGNLRWSSKATQARNTRVKSKNNTSGYRGVTVNGKNWKAVIGIDSKPIYIGTYDTAKEAAIAYDNYVKDNGLNHKTNELI